MWVAAEVARDAALVIVSMVKAYQWVAVWMSGLLSTGTVGCEAWRRLGGASEASGWAGDDVDAAVQLGRGRHCATY